MSGLTRDALVALSEWIDAGNAHRDAEAVTWGRLAKIAEEHGEVIEAFIGWTGQNPRKGVTHTRQHVEKELLDVAITALGALEHLRGHDGMSLPLLEIAIVKVAERAGVVRESHDLEPDPVCRLTDSEGRVCHGQTGLHLYTCPAFDAEAGGIPESDGLGSGGER